MEEHDYRISKSVRYVTIGEPSSKVKNLWVFLHGYGQLAVWFARNFKNLESSTRLILVPEGVHRFYLQGTAGRVGASWMTKEARLADIEDQYHYLEGLVSDVVQQLPEDCTIHVLGFSQGVSTAFRWLLRSEHKFKSLVCWAGSFPPEIDYARYSELFSAMRISACFGDKDEYISDENANKLVSMLTGAEINVNAHFYKGGHRIHAELLAEVMALHEG